MNQSKKIFLTIALVLLFGAPPSIVLTDWESYNDESWQSQKPNTYSDESWSTKERPCTKCSMKKFSPQTTFVGKKIAIRGYGFGSEPGEVIFSENVKAEIISWSTRRIWILVPEGAITGTVKVVKNCPSGRYEVSQPIKIGNPTSD